MIVFAARSVYETAQRKMVDLTEEVFGDLVHWFDRLSDLERLVGLCVFILTLFVMIIAKSATGSAGPGNTRGFLGSFALVVAFSFLTGLVIDSRFDPRQLLGSDFISRFA
ncbi:MAG: hypothetical protein R3C08_04660 [Hyphomonas sp.]|nr:hypothetical protein [Hyphomonas sp.]HRX73759.1 hypothetical protein [Hyphomonas sp.]